jgi:hypothetical protein
LIPCRDEKEEQKVERRRYSETGVSNSNVLKGLTD